MLIVGTVITLGSPYVYLPLSSVLPQTKSKPNSHLYFKQHWNKVMLTPFGRGAQRSVEQNPCSFILSSKKKSGESYSWAWIKLVTMPTVCGLQLWMHWKCFSSFFSVNCSFSNQRWIFLLYPFKREHASLRWPSICVLSCWVDYDASQPKCPSPLPCSLLLKSLIQPAEMLQFVDSQAICSPREPLRCKGEEARLEPIAFWLWV